jgi:hypothetical protein
VNDATNPKPDTSSIKRTAIYAAFPMVVFLFAYVPISHTFRECFTFSQTERRPDLATIETILSSAAIDARLGNYEKARRAAGDFFALLRSEAARGDHSTLSKTQRENLQPIFIPREEIITLLARSEPASADRLADLYVSYRKLMTR